MYQGGRIGAHVARDTGVTIDLSKAVIEEVINAGNLGFQESIPSTPDTWTALRGVFGSETAERKLAGRAITG